MKQVALKAEEAEIAGWKKRAEEAGLGLSAWIRLKCSEESGFVAGAVSGGDVMVIEGKPPAGKLKRPPSEKKVKRAAAAEKARASVVIPQRKGGMVDVKMAPPDFVSKCPHGHRQGEVCYKCDPKMGFPNFPE